MVVVGKRGGIVLPMSEDGGVPATRYEDALATGLPEPKGLSSATTEDLRVFAECVAPSPNGLGLAQVDAIRVLDQKNDWGHTSRNYMAVKGCHWAKDPRVKALVADIEAGRLVARESTKRRVVKTNLLKGRYEMSKWLSKFNADKAGVSEANAATNVSRHLGEVFVDDEKDPEKEFFRRLVAMDDARKAVTDGEDDV